MDQYVQRDGIEVLRVRADMKGKGPAEAFRALESRLPNLKRRRFYGAFRLLPEGEEYYACVERSPDDDPKTMALEIGTLPGGLYVRRKVLDWESVVRAGKLGEIVQEMVHRYPVDTARPELEFYRSRSELHLLVPVLRREPTGPSRRPVRR